MNATCHNVLLKIGVRQQKRWADLSPVVRTIEKYHSNECEELLVLIGELRYLNTNSVWMVNSQERDLASIVRQIREIMDLHPELKNKNGFSDFETNSKRFDEDIHRYRTIYNMTAMRHNRLIHKRPYNMVARVFGQNAFEYLEEMKK